MVAPPLPEAVTMGHWTLVALCFHDLTFGGKNVALQHRPGLAQCPISMGHGT